MTNEFPIGYEIAVDWSEIDSFGHVNNLAIMRYVQSTRVHVLEQCGMMEYHKETGHGPTRPRLHASSRRGGSDAVYIVRRSLRLKF